MNEGYMDAGNSAGIDTPDTGDDTLREQLAAGIKELLPVDPDDGTVVSEFGDFGPIWDTADEVSRGYADALLPRIREHVAAARHLNAEDHIRLYRLLETAEARAEQAEAVQGERERPPTQWAYDQACKSLDKHRERAEAAEAEVERLRTVTGMADQAGADILDERNNALAAIERVRKLHEPTGTHLVAEIDGFGGEQRDIEPDSFEEITSREVVCMACAGYPEAPCSTIRALDGTETP